MRERLRPKDKKQSETNPIDEVIETARGNAICRVDSLIILRKVRPLLSLSAEGGFVNIFPDTKHKRHDYSFPGLCPSKLGPIEHGLPGLPSADNLQAFFEYSCCYNTDLRDDGQLWNEFREQMREGFRSGIPRPKEGPKARIVSMVSCDPEGTLIIISESEWRKSYCRFYSTLAEETDDYKRLIRIKDERNNIAICSTKVVVGSDNPREEYENTDIPFAHEKVLWTMLTMKNPNLYPWLLK